jgi:sortase A
MTRLFPYGSRAFTALLLFCMLFTVYACDPTPKPEDGDSPSKDAKVASDTEITRAAREKTTAPTAAEQAMDTAFVHRATGENSRGDYTYLSDPSIDGDPNAVVLVTPSMDRGSNAHGTYGHNVGVWYEPQAEKWAIFNQDRAAVPGGTTFQVVVPGGPERFVHRSEPGNTTEKGTYLDDPLVNGKPAAMLSVTQNWNPGGGAGVYNDHPVSVRYDAGRQRWTIYNTDGSMIPDGAAFNVGVSEGTQATGADAGDPDAEQGAKPTEEVSAKAGSDTNTGQKSETKEAPEWEDTGDSAQASGESKGFPEYRDFFSEGDPRTPAKLVSSDSSTGAIPGVKPFNFGRDPGGPKDTTLYLTISKLGLEDVPVFDTVSEEKLRDGTVHIPATGYPWQEGANVFIAGHRIGYENTFSYYVFFRLDELVDGDEILLEDSAGGQYRYRINKQVGVGPDSVEVMNPVEGKSLITLQTCTLPDYKKRLIVQGELVKRDPKEA